MPKRLKKVKKDDKKNKNKQLNMANLDEMDADAGIDFEKLVRTEYLKLQRDYRLLEDRHHQLAGAGKSLTKKARLVELLRNEAQDLETDLYNADAPEWKAIDRKSNRSMLRILDLYERAVGDSTYCLRSIREMVSHVDKISKQLIEHQLKVQAIYGNAMTVAQAERRQKILENRLYLYTTRFDTKVFRNKGLREEINMMLKLRGLFFKRYTGMKKHLAKIRVRMNEVVFTATQYYEQRDDIVTGIRNLRDKNDKDTRQHVLDIKEFHRVLHHDAKVREFNSLKNKERLMLESALQRSIRRNFMRNEEFDAAIYAYIRNFRLILLVSKYPTLDSLIKHYKESEQENFSRFVAIADANHEVTVLKDETLDMSTEIEELYKDASAIEESRKTELESFAHYLERKGNELVQVEHLLLVVENHLKEILDVLDALFRGSNASPAVLLNLLGAQQPVKATPRNALLVMESIEIKARELLVDKSHLELRKAVEVDHMPLNRATAGKTKAAGGGTKEKVSGGPFVPDIIVSGRVDGEDEQDDEDHGNQILSPVDYREKILESMRNKKLRESQSSFSIMGRSFMDTERNESIVSSRASVWENQK